MKEIRILRYRLDRNWRMGEHREYWLGRGIGVRRRIGVLGRRYGSRGGLGASECMRLIQSVYIPTVYYGLEFQIWEKGGMKNIQTHINDTLRLTFRMPIKYATNILLVEMGIVSIEVEERFI